MIISLRPIQSITISGIIGLLIVGPDDSSHLQGDYR